MTTGFRQASHPLLKESVLYFPEIPNSVPWTSIIRTFSCCGTVLSTGKYYAMPDSKAWTVKFPDLLQAEMALATLHGTPIFGTTPPIVLALSHTPDLAVASPQNPLLPQFVQTDQAEHPLRNTSAQDVFRWFRNAGPLVSVRMNVDVGHERRTCVLEYWEETHAKYARTHYRSLDAALGAMPAFTLRTFDPCNLYCAKLGSQFKQADFSGHFGKFGDIVVATLINAGTSDAYGFVSFRERGQATAAMSEMNGKVIGSSALRVRYHEPKWQATFRIPPNARSASKSQAQTKTKGVKTQAGQGEQEASKIAEEARCREEEERKREEAEALERKKEELRKRKEEARQKKKEEEERRKREGEEALRKKREEEERQRKMDEEAQRKKKEEEALRRRREAEEAARRSRERQMKMEAAARRRDNAEKIYVVAQVKFEVLEQEHGQAQDRLAAATNEADAATAALSEAHKAVKAAERILAEAKGRQAEAAQRAGDAVVGRVNAQTYEQQMSMRMQIALEDKEISWREQEAAERAERAVLEEIAAEDAETRRQQELAESIRKMRELWEQEEIDQRENEQRARREEEEENLRRLAAERLAQEERERQAIEEAERLEREKNEQAEREEMRRRTYEAASGEERERCKQRDFARWNIHKSSLWTKERSVDRFATVSIEFDETRFHDSQPLTCESVPWPVLLSPYHLKLEDIQWSAVEEFFRAAKLVIGESEYKTMVEKAHRRFHPDKWRSRGLLKTVLDEELRKGLEEAGNIVAQAVTPLWLATKSK